MPGLAHSLSSHDLGYLRIVAELWGVEFQAADVRSGAAFLSASILDRELALEVVEALAEEPRAGLNALLENEGRLPWAQFQRRYGELREMGPGRRDRERPQLQPASASEALWYRALMQRAFFDTADGPEEHAYVPDELLALLSAPASAGQRPFGRPATPEERAEVIPASDAILDWSCTLLAALRLGFDEAQLEEISAAWPMSHKALSALLAAAKILEEKGNPEPEATRDFLSAGRGEAFAALFQAWLDSADYNDLRLLPGLEAEGEWENDPLKTRHTILAFLEALPAGDWWSLPAFLADLKAQQPDFQRPAGDYDSWYLRDLESGEYLRGFAHWEAVDGALARQLICGPLHWLGVFDLGAPEADRAPRAFRRSAWAEALLNGQAPGGLPAEEGKVQVDGRARIHAAPGVPRVARYQMARFCEWLPMKAGDHHYQITPASLARAQEQGLAVGQLMSLLKRHAAAEVAPNVVKALRGWEEHGTQARVEQALVLRVGSPEILEKLRASRAARFLGDPLGPTVVAVKPGAWENVMGALAELGYLAEAREEGE